MRVEKRRKASNASKDRQRRTLTDLGERIVAEAEGRTARFVESISALHAVVRDLGKRVDALQNELGPMRRLVDIREREREDVHVLLRRAIGVISDMQKHEGEARAVLDAFAAMR